MKQIVADENLVAHCGLYCGACRKYLVGQCPGCQKNEKASWCKVRACCSQNSYKSCADCKRVKHVSDCRDFDNFISKLFAFIFRSDRKACVNLIKKIGYVEYAQEMSGKKIMTLKKTN